MNWKIYYDDGSTYSNQNGEIFFAPGQGVEVISYEDTEVGRRILHRADYYWPTEFGFGFGDMFALYEYLLSPGPKKVLFGKTISDCQFQNILKAAIADDYLPPKSAKHSLEK